MFPLPTFVPPFLLQGQHEIRGRRVDVKKAISRQEINQMGGPKAVKEMSRGGGGGRNRPAAAGRGTKNV